MRERNNSKNKHKEAPHPWWNAFVQNGGVKESNGIITAKTRELRDERTQKRECQVRGEQSRRCWRGKKVTQSMSNLSSSVESRRRR